MKVFSLSLAIVLIALPMWWWHWRRWRALTQIEAPFFFRLYVYVLMLLLLIAAVLYGASALGKVFMWLWGITDFTTRIARLTFAQESGISIINALIALLAWWYHGTHVRSKTEN